MSQENVAGQTLSVGDIPEDYVAFEHYQNTGKVPDADESIGPEAASSDEEVKPQTADDAGSSEDKQESSEESDEDEKPKTKKGGWQRAKEKAERERDALQGRVAELEKRLGGDKPATERIENPAGDGRPVAPKLEDFADWNEYRSAEVEYLDKLTDWKIEQRDQARAAKAHQAEVAKTWEARVAEAQKSIADLDEVLSEADIEISPAMQETIVGSELGPQLAYHLAKNPSDAERIAKLPPIAAARELGKLEAQLSTPAPKKTKVPSAAPEPVKPVAGGKSTAVALDDPEISFAEFERKANKRFLR